MLWILADDLSLEDNMKIADKLIEHGVENNLIGDPDKIKRILANLIDNAIKYTEKGYFLPFKEESYLRIVNDPINEGKMYGAFLDNKMVAELI